MAAWRHRLVASTWHPRGARQSGRKPKRPCCSLESSARNGSVSYIAQVGDSAIISAAAGVVGAMVGGGAAIWAAHVAAEASERATVAKESRDETRSAAEAISAARRVAAGDVICDLQSMRDAWTGGRTSSIDDTHRVGHLWDLHEKVRVRALLLPNDLQEEIAVLNWCLRFADEIGGDGFRPEGFIFLGKWGVAQLAYETAEERLRRYIAGDVALPWPPDALRLKAAHADHVRARQDEYAAEAHEYASEREAFDESHPFLSASVERSKQLRGSSEDQ